MKTDEPAAVGAYLDGTATPEQVASLDAVLRADVAARRQLLAEAMLRLRISDVLTRTADPEVRPASPVAGRTRPGWWILARAAGLVAAALLGVAAWRVYRPRSGFAPQPTAVVRTAARGLPRMVPLDALARRPGAMHVTACAGRAWVQSDWDERAVAVSSGMVVQAGVRLVTEADGALRARLTDTGDLQAFGRTVWSCFVTNGVAGVRLAGGAIDFSVRPRSAAVGEAFTVLTRDLAVRVQGTEFRVLADAGSSWVGVRSGVVEVCHLASHRRVRLAAGQYLSTHPQLPLQALSAECPYWRAACREATGGAYP